MERELIQLIQSFVYCQVIVQCKDDSIPNTGLPVKDWIKNGEKYLAYGIKQNLNSSYGESSFSYNIMDKSGTVMTPFDGYETYKAERFEVLGFICMN
jgi:hypothetical protein